MKNNFKVRVSKKFHFLALLIALFANSSLQAQEQITADLLKKISTAEQELLKTEKSVANQRRKLANQLSTLEAEVLVLREKTAAVRRLADEKTLSLSQLENRLKTWNQQQAYQQGLLQRFLQQQDDGSNQPILNDVSLSNKLEKVLTSSQQFERNFSPSWQQSKVILPSGDITQLATLSMGPISWYWNEATGKAGIASKLENEAGLLQSDMQFQDSDSSTIRELYNQEKGSVVFDPTMNRAMARQQHSESFFEHVVKGGKWAIPIVFFAVFALSIALIKVTQLGRLSKVIRFTPSILSNALANNGRHSEGAAQPKVFTKVQGMQQRLLEIALNAKSTNERDDQLFMQLQDDKTRLERWIGAIGITAAVSPLLGLLGTVSGMIETFKMMTLFGSGDPEVVSGGIAQALVTTELGLVVAIPALILNALLSRKAKSYYNELESFAILLSKSGEQVDVEENQSLANEPVSKKQAKEASTTQEYSGSNVSLNDAMSTN
ncbi:MotA/TolQ/ExbB proton channel family protein [Alteromonas sp. 1_MG-2023]|uniref:MotA/TolQ/ExbB proton channel family protein n=1 Tax=Alteromonas sp. 1_MG-2023 TaxID=3062669 RepID=UPI0026E23813|nr:MotA/TolQ/ExbB proton channel family protein [Alteromonas sp. 1_MG-2023]MDO6567708.1 MotA/TolQ/ExbB proton channel family protein [Alteromonas sp. 1_MG-2023]